MPSPVSKSAIPCNDAKVNNLAKTGTSWTLKLSIFSNEFEVLPFLIE